MPPRFPGKGTWKGVTWPLELDDTVPFLNMEGKACILIREGGELLGEVEVSVGDEDQDMRSSI